jgi:hypothetical protein
VTIYPGDRLDAWLLAVAVCTAALAAWAWLWW